MIALPSYSDDQLAALSTRDLIDLMLHDEDRVPRNVIDACARRGDEMIGCLDEVLRSDDFGKDDLPPGVWWLGLHAVMILGLIPGERAGLSLARAMRLMAERDDEDLQEWLAGYWPALFANKPDSVLPPVRSVCEERDFDWYIRANALDPVVAAAERRGGQVLEDALAWLETIAADETEEWTFRLMAGNLLLDFPRERYRPLLEELARRQGGLGAYFSVDDVRTAYSPLKAEPEWRARNDPWGDFYAPKAIQDRQQRWAEEAETPATFVRETLKIGRNDPCPCGSGKKYKKCCLARPEAP